MHPDDRERVSLSVQQALGGRGALDYEFRIVLPDGACRWLADQGLVVRDASGKLSYMTGVCLDVTERKQVDERLRQAQRMESVGQLAGGIAHEANNMMSVVLGCADYVLQRSDLPEVVRRGCRPDLAGGEADGGHHPAVAGVQPPSGAPAAGRESERGG